MKFIVMTPGAWEGSAGIYALHALAENLNKIGHKAYLLFYNIGLNAEQRVRFESDGKFYYTDLTYIPQGEPEGGFEIKKINDYIVVIPESVPENPLGASRIIRYVLSFNKKNVGSSGAREFLLAYLPNYAPNADAFFCPTQKIPRHLIQKASEDLKKGVPRHLNLTYIGKGVSGVESPFVFPNSVEITRQWPSRRLETLIILSNTKDLYSWDPLSATNMEAIILGANVIHPNLGTYKPEDFNFKGVPIPFRLLNYDKKSNKVSSFNNYIDYREARERLIQVYGEGDALIHEARLVVSKLRNFNWG